MGIPWSDYRSEEVQGRYVGDITELYHNRHIPGNMCVFSDTCLLMLYMLRLYIHP